MLSVVPHTKRSGGIVTTSEPTEITAVGCDFLLDLLAQHGYVLLRGFTTNIDGFSRLVRQTSGRISLDPARRFNGDTAQKVDAGTDPVGLHCENGNSPFWPELCWFYCECEPRIGSQTTVCDGYLVYDDLRPEARAAFAGQDIVYSRNVSETMWKAYALHALADQEDGPTQLEQITVAHLQGLMAASGEGSSVALNEDNSIYYRFRTPAIRQSAISGDTRLAFANSIFGPSYNYETPVITFADGTPIPTDLLAEVDAVCDRHTHEVGWHTGDVVLIDNTRAMHGRRHIEDTGRIIYNALSYRA
ncbi:TauD/TfdA family dioxygenase [Ferrovum sp.]|uniref:TauD/TfdA family dioxygenase n=1 Tax=Ferrovum sp. TaxID=2609467 RepID=UPI00260C9C17|nr:TauD/TfdA family dioxygenase [Ferrovum sp.]